VTAITNRREIIAGNIDDILKSNPDNWVNWSRDPDERGTKQSDRPAPLADGDNRQQLGRQTRPAPGRLAVKSRTVKSPGPAQVAEYGQPCWEADILPANVIGEALDNHIASWLDRK